jgi:shikimate dehydrogenase
MTAIDGQTRIFGIIADPVAQVKTPQGINRLAATHGANSIMIPFHVAAADLAAAFTGLRTMKNFGGMIVTVPHKTAALAFCDEVSARAQRVGAVNAIRRETSGRLIGDIFDGLGFVAGMEQAGIDVKGRRVYLVGAGGAASAIAFALADATVAELTIANRTTAKAVQLASLLRKFYPELSICSGTADPSGHEIVINATSLGMKEDDPHPLDTTGLSPEMTVAEIIMEPEMTPLLAAAKDCGCRLHFGKSMLVCQLELMASFMGVMTPPVPMPDLAKRTQG